MNAIRFIQNQLILDNIPIPKPAKHEALLKVIQAGVCNTDLEIIKGYFSFTGTIGHEFVALVEESDDPSLIGKRVVCDINCACYQCTVCQQGNFHHCPNRTVIGIVGKDGAFAQYLTAPIKNLFIIPSQVTNEKAVFVEPLAAALEIGEQIDLTQKKEALVFGDGKLGLLIALSLEAQGVLVTLVGRHPERKKRFANTEIEYLLTPPDKTFGLVVEATGNPDGLELAISHTTPRGHLVLKSTYAESFSFNPSLLVVNEITLLGSRCGPFAKAIEFLEQGRVDPLGLIDERFSLLEGVAAIHKAQEKGVLKVLLDF